MRQQYIIFDWDGTLMDSTGKIVSCMQSAAKLSHLPVPEKAAVEQIIGISLQPAIQRLFNISENEAIDIVTHYKHIYKSLDQTPCPLYSGTVEMLKALINDGRKLAVATGKARRGLERAWDNTITRDFFERSKTADDAMSKPSPDMLEQLLNEWGIEAEQAIMIGDTEFDMQMAQALGMECVAITHGAHTEAQLRANQPTKIVHSIQELEQLLLG